MVISSVDLYVTYAEIIKNMADIAYSLLHTNNFLFLNFPRYKPKRLRGVPGG